MKTAAAVMMSLMISSGAGAQCLGDFNDSGAVEINELIIAVNNSLSGCSGEPTPTPGGETCPIDFSDDNTANGTPDCFYVGSWNQSCGDDNLEARWISDGIDNDGQDDLVVIELLGFEPDFLFLAADVTSPTSAQLFAWFTVLNPDADDLFDLSGTATLPNAQAMTITSDGDFSIDECDFVRYDGVLIDSTQGALRRGSVANLQLSRPALERLREMRAARRAKPNFQRQ